MTRGTNSATGNSLSDAPSYYRSFKSTMTKPSQKRLERQAPQPEMTTTEIIKSLITVVGVVAFIVLLGVLVEWLLLNT